MSLVLGLTLIVVARLLRQAPDGGSDPPIVVPVADQFSGQLKRAAIRFVRGLAVFGLVGLPLSVWRGFSGPTTFLLSAAVAFVFALIPPVRLPRRRASEPESGIGAVVRAISPGGFGQVEMVHQGTRVVLAARSADEEGIPAGCEVEIVDASRSVLTVRRRDSRP